MDDYTSVSYPSEFTSSSRIDITSIAILSGLLLAGNNPNTLEGVLALPTIDKEEAKIPFPNIWILNQLKFELAYPSRYKISWLWWRGRRKQEWLETVIQIYSLSKGVVGENERVEVPGQHPFKKRHIDPQMLQLRKIINLH